MKEGSERRPPRLPDLRVRSPVGFWLRRYLLWLTLLVLGGLAASGAAVVERWNINVSSGPLSGSVSEPPS
ncbi:MAG: hypothetical protein AAF725_26890 [Acidobacteriota bacterium]